MAADTFLLVRFGVLGPLAAWTTDGHPVRVSEVKVRALLAVLLIEVGRPVSVDRLVQDLWGDRPPASPSNSVQTKVSQLRRMLEDGEPGARRLVVRQAPGYLLRVEPDEVDVTRFRALAARAAAVDDPRRRVALWSEALELWRGPALADFADEPFATAVVAQWEEERLGALEGLVEARIDLGEHAAVIGELNDLTERHPLRERLHAARMRALYRSGRQTDALAGYRALRERLADELGVEPGPELAAVHQAILEQNLEAAPPRPLSNLPAPVSDLIGRDEAVVEVGDLVGKYRLVTLTGPGGVGKTRLAVETARHVVARDGAWLVEFAGPVDAPIEEVVAAALGLREDTGTIVEALRGKQMLLVLDNCERMVGPVAEFTARLLAAAPGLRVVATSQEPLGLAGEQLWPVPPLEVPGESEHPPEFSAVQLFVARAGAAAPGFTLTFDNLEAVAAICRRLDGIPLALEMAATRVRALGVHELLDRLDDRFRLLATGHRDAPARQRTLRAVIDWSWELLSEAERAVLSGLAVHAESCSLEAAERVCGGDDVVDQVVRLVGRSLVVVLPGPRYRLLESVAAYCLEQLRERGELDALRRAHLDYYTDLAERADGRLRGGEQRTWLRRLTAEGPNLRTALDHAVRIGDADVALRLVNAQAWYWFLRGRLREGQRSLSTALSVVGGDERERVRATAWLAGFAALIGEGGGLAEQAAKALAAFEGVDDPAGLARAQWFLSHVLNGSGDLDALADLAGRSLAGFTAVGDRWGAAAALSTLAAQARPRGSLGDARRCAERSAEVFRALGDRWGQVKVADVLSSLAEIDGDYDEAERLHLEALRGAEELGLSIEMSYELSGLGRIELLRGDYERAEGLHWQAMRLATEQSHLRGVQFAEVGLGIGARRQGRLDKAEKHLTAWLEWCRGIDGELGVALIMAELGFVAEQRGDVELALARQREGHRAAKATGDPRSVALSMEGLAGAYTLAGDHVRAARLLGAAAEARGGPLPWGERGDVDRISAAVELALGSEVFKVEFRHGVEGIAKVVAIG